MPRLFPIDTNKASWGGSVTPKWAVTQQESASGMVRAIVEQDLPKYEYSLQFPMLSAAEKDSLLGFYNQCKGSLLPFFIKDDHVEKQQLAVGTDGKYQLVKRNGDYIEAVYYADGLSVYVDDALVDTPVLSNGKFVLETSGTVTASYNYYDQVRFSGNISFTEKFKDFWTCSFKVVTAR